MDSTKLFAIGIGMFIILIVVWGTWYAFRNGGPMDRDY